MAWRTDRTFVFALSVFALASLALIPSLYSFDAYAATNFGIDYRHLTAVSPGGVPDTTSTVTVGAGVTGSFIVDPYTSGSTATAAPTTSTLSGYGWRTAGIVGSSIPAGTWSFTVTTQATLTSVLGNGKVKVFAYSTDTLGSNLVSIGSATGTNNVFAVLVAQTETITFSASSVDLTNNVLVVEFWIDVTTGPLLATTITFQAASSSQTVVLPSSGTFYLGKSSLFSVGETESAATTDASPRSLIMTRVPTVSAAITDTNPSRNIAAHRTTSEVSGAEITDVPSRVVTSSRQLSEISTAVITEGVSKTGGFVRQVTETSAAAVDESVSRLSSYTRNATEASGAFVSDSISRAAMFVREISEAPILISDLINAILGNFTPPPEDEDRERQRGRGGGHGVIIDNEPPLVQPPQIEDEITVQRRHLEVGVSEKIEIQIGEKAAFTAASSNVSISSSLIRIYTSLQPIPPSAIGSVILEITNYSNNTEYALLQYWYFEEGTGYRLAKGAEELTLSPHQSVSKDLAIPFTSPGDYILEASISGNNGDSRGMTTMEITVPWIAVYLSLLITFVVGAIASIGSYILVTRHRHRKSSVN